MWRGVQKAEGQKQKMKMRFTHFLSVSLALALIFGDITHWGISVSACVLVNHWVETN